jgi:hypothetical protein
MKSPSPAVPAVSRLRDRYPVRPHGGGECRADLHHPKFPTDLSGGYWPHHLRKWDDVPRAGEPAQGPPSRGFTVCRNCGTVFASPEGPATIYRSGHPDGPLVYVNGVLQENEK